MKYIVLDGPGGEAAVLFPRTFAHAWIAQVMLPMSTVSAGFVRWVDGRPDCYGESAGLKIGARPMVDSALVARALGAPGPESE